MANIKKETVTKLQGFHVEKDGVDFKIVIENLRIIVIRTDERTAATEVFLWDWAEVAERLSGNVTEAKTGDKATSRLPTDPASRRSIPGTGAEPEKAIDPASQRSIPGTGDLTTEEKKEDAPAEETTSAASPAPEEELPHAPHRSPLPPLTPGVGPLNERKG